MTRPHQKEEVVPRVPQKRSWKQTWLVFNERNYFQGDTSGRALDWSGFPKNAGRPMICCRRFQGRIRASEMRQISVLYHRADVSVSIPLLMNHWWRNPEDCRLYWYGCWIEIWKYWTKHSRLWRAVYAKLAPRQPGCRRINPQLSSSSYV